MKFIDPSLIRYLLVGGFNTALTYVLYLLALVVLPYQLAYSVVYVIGIFTSYVLNSLFVFQEALHWKKALQYPVVYLVQYVLGIAVLTFLVNMLGIDARFAALINIVVALPLTFVLSRTIIKRPA